MLNGGVTSLPPEGFLPNEEDQFEVDIALGLLNAYYFIIDNDILCWDTEDVIHCVPTDKFDIYNDIDEAIKDIKKAIDGNKYFIATGNSLELFGKEIIGKE